MPQQSPWTPEKEAELARRWEAGERQRGIARAMGLTPGQIAGKAMRLSLQRGGLMSVKRIVEGSYADVEAVTSHPTQVRQVEDHDRVLKGGRDQRKLGDYVTKGRWKGFPIFSLTLEERATCPRTCLQWLSCYGNSMNFARRWRHGGALERKIWWELKELQRRHPGGFVVRLHILGDFYSVGYVELWREALQAFDGLRVWGYTAWQPKSRIGRAVAELRDSEWDRFAVRTSGAREDPSTHVIAQPEHAGDAIICPVEHAKAKKAKNCGACGLCWASKRPIAFIEH